MPFSQRKLSIPSAADALPGRGAPMAGNALHAVHGTRIRAPFSESSRRILFGMGCFWGAERNFWQLPKVTITAVGYAAGSTPNPTYEEVCSGGTGHNEVVMISYEPDAVSFATLLASFWENHDPTQGMRQGNDRGTQYRSGIYVFDKAELAAAEASRVTYQERLSAAGHGTITTEIQLVDEFYYAEEYHQQYLAKNPEGYCGLGGTGVACPIGLT